MLLQHIGVWCVLLLFPLLLTDRSDPMIFLMRHARTVLILGFVFYLYYLVLVPRLFLTGKKYTFVAISVVVLISLALVFMITDIPPSDKPNMPRPGGRKDSGLMGPFLWIRSFTLLTLGAGTALGMRFAQSWRQERERRKSLENEQLKSELSMLKYQLQPHFFFNSLNTIYSSIDDDPSHAKDTVHKLSKLMRYLLYKANDQSVALKDEITFLSAYIELMKSRVGSHVDVMVSFPAKDLDHLQIEPLMFISLVENAFKHGIHAQKPSHIRIDMKQTSTGSLQLKVVNSNFPKSNEDQSGSGIGLSNLKKRLERLYPDSNNRLQQEIVDNQYIATLTIPTA
ncbi:sensor histidine kinase [Marinoscillum furvescens]|nr:histidine kinase [Marinoscillum furvescens]